ncbi:MAG: TrmH family RNA methyltransferase [Acidimicrobiales bacterium]
MGAGSFKGRPGAAPPTQPHFQRITDPADRRLRPYLHLTDPALRRGYETSEGLFIAEGRLVVERLLGSRYPVRSVLVTEGGARRMAGVLAASTTTVMVVEEELTREITGFHLHRGILACAARLPLPEPRALTAEARVVMILEDIADQTNMGSLFRSALALGVDAALLSPDCCDPLYRRSVRVSMAASLRLPYAVVEPWPVALAGLAGTHHLLALTPDPTAVALADFVGSWSGGPLAVVLGSEGAGLSQPVLSSCQTRVRIPMRAGTDSLNVATAAAIAFAYLADAGPDGRRRRGPPTQPPPDLGAEQVS